MVGGDNVIFVVLDILFHLIKKRLATGKKMRRDWNICLGFIKCSNQQRLMAGFEILDGATKEENTWRIHDLIVQEFANY